MAEDDGTAKRLNPKKAAVKKKKKKRTFLSVIEIAFVILLRVLSYIPIIEFSAGLD